MEEEYSEVVEDDEDDNENEQEDREVSARASHPSSDGHFNGTRRASAPHKS